MKRLIAFVVILFLMTGLGISIAQDVSKLTTAKSDFEQSIQKARINLLAELKKKQENAQAFGDLKTLEKVEEEIKLFGELKTLPKTVSTRVFLAQVKLAQGKINEAYSGQIKQLTMSGNINQAKALQKELQDTIKASGYEILWNDEPLELTTAKLEFELDLQKAQEGLIQDLKKKQNEAQKVGDLKTIEKIDLELKAFEEGNKLPKMISTRVFESQIHTNNIKLTEAFNNAIRQYTIAGNFVLAKAIQKEFDELKNTLVTFGTDSSDPLQPNSIWENEKLSLTIKERKGENYKGIFESKEWAKEVNGKIKGNNISWLGKDVKNIRNSKGSGDNFGTVKKDDQGYKIDFWFQNDAKSPKGYFILRQKTKTP